MKLFSIPGQHKKYIGDDVLFSHCTQKRIIHMKRENTKREYKDPCEVFELELEIPG